MLRVVHTGTGLPASYPLDPTSEFESGMVAQLKIIGNDIVAGVSDGTAPLGLIDDVRTSAFTKAQVDEVVIIEVNTLHIGESNGVRVSLTNQNGPLEFPHINRNSFTSTLTVTLNDVNGIITVPTGTPLNYDSDGDGDFNAFKVVVSYVYRIATKPGDDSTVGSGRITVHYQRGIYATDQFDTLQLYPLNANLYVGVDGKLTTEQPTENHPAIAWVSGPPSAANGTLEFMWL
tara:strand:+ start:727 stop:1422 length:696 start_codon:yes stop_codon:yes gene_type:complete